jgi:hypothetical protein
MSLQVVEWIGVPLHLVPDVDDMIIEPGLVGAREWRPQDDEAAGEKFAGIVGVAVKR